MSVDPHNAALGRAMEEVGYPKSVVDDARRGKWSDFKSELPFPKMDLVNRLSADGHEDLARRVATGEFDG